MFCKKCGKQIEDDSRFCEYCGARMTEESQPMEPTKVQSESSQRNYPPPQQGSVQNQGHFPTTKERGGVAELVVGIISIILSAFIIFQSCIAGIGNALTDNEDGGGASGAVIAICMLIGGIVGMATRKSEGKGGAITSAGFYLITSLIGFTGAGSFKDLKVYAVIGLIFAVIFIWAAFSRKKA